MAGEVSAEERQARFNHFKIHGLGMIPGDSDSVCFERPSRCMQRYERAIATATDAARDALTTFATSGEPQPRASELLDPESRSLCIWQSYQAARDRGRDVAGAGGGSWPCTMCTFVNQPSAAQCDMCEALAPSPSPLPSGGLEVGGSGDTDFGQRVPDYATIDVEIVRETMRDPFGIMLGTFDGNGLHVIDVVPGTVAHGKVLACDIITAINATSCSGLSHDEMVMQLKAGIVTNLKVIRFDAESQEYLLAQCV